MTKRIFRSICFVALAVFLACLVLILGVLYSYFTSARQSQLRAQTALAAQGIAGEGLAFFEGLEPQDYRITWIAADGSVLYDSRSNAAEMENHLQRQEIRDALAEGYGESIRYSSTLAERWLYSAQLLPDGSVVRLSCAQASVALLVLGMLQPFLLVALLAVVLSLLLAHRLSRRIVDPLNRLDLDAPLKNQGYDELFPLLRRIDAQQRQLRAQTQELRQRQDEFDAITGSMTEGLVLLNNQSRILSINPAAASILGADRDCPGKNLLSVNPSLALQELLLQARSGRRAERTLSLPSGSYQLAASPVFSEGLVTGAALLLFDVTERESSEQMRREFTANVSHELKTPLHSISGCAELLQSGLVKPEDQAQFSSQIYSEAQRMIRLVDDIIRLSRLDEGAADMAPEPLDLHSLCQSVLLELQPEGERAGVSLSLEGEAAPMEGMPQLLHGVVYNLCDNAIKYNRPGGSVTLRVRPEGSETVLSVSDTGIGIPPEHQSRIFERFYRVDKSRSDQAGGTGLGLSIVKHAVRLHEGRLELQSRPGEGSTFTVRFPQKNQNA